MTHPTADNPLKHYIAGNWQSPERAIEQTVVHASTAEPLFQQLAASESQLEAAIATVHTAHEQGTWSGLDLLERAEILEAIAEALVTKSEAIALADSQATGVILSLTKVVGSICPHAFRSVSAHLRELAAKPAEPMQGPHGNLAIERLPLGAVAVIAPWNAPSGISCHKLASALAAGCTVVMKPSEWAPLSGQLIAEAVVEVLSARGFADIFQLVHGDGATGAALCQDSRIAAVSFTGGLIGGRAVAQACAADIKPAQLELGGNNALVVLADADIDRAADAVVTALTTLNGQWCRALGRLLVHSSLHNALIAAVEQRLADVRIGNSEDEQSQMGPLVHAGHLQHVREAAERYQSLGAILHQVTPLPDLPGHFFPPTLVSNLDPAHSIDEVFGPLAAVHSFDTDEEAIALANQTPFGLAGYVFGEEDHAWKIAKAMRTGIVKINAVTMLNLNPLAPRPAWGLSGIGDEGVAESFEFFRGTRVIGVAAR